jgi:hypothetical protein
MSKLIKYNDFIQINPDKRILSLDKKSKITLIDNLLSNVEFKQKGLVITYDLSHSGRKINNRIYSTKGQQKGIDSLTNPYPKPILKHHDQNGEPIGRFIGGEWQSLNDEAASFLNSNKSMLDIHNAFTEDDPQKIYKTLKDLNLLNNKDWPGLGRMRVKANVTDEEAIKRFLDGRYLTFSAGSTTDRHICSICDQDWVSDGMCEHRHGKTYDDETCVFVTGDFIVLEGSVVNTPADDLSQVVEMELIDTSSSKPIEDNSSEHLIIFPKEIIMSDSNYDLGAGNELQAVRKAYKRVKRNQGVEALIDSAKLEDQNYDHRVVLDEKIMRELHTKGVAYVEAPSKVKATIIQIAYSGEKNLNEPPTQKEDIMKLEKEQPDEEVVDSTEAVAEAEPLVVDNQLQKQDDPDEGDFDEDETADEVSLDVDWNILDLALQTVMVKSGNSMSNDERKELPDAIFCGPERSFPIPDCAHVTAAKDLISKTKLSDTIKSKILTLIDEKAEALECDSEVSILKSDLKDLQEMYKSLEEKFKVVVEFIEANKKVSADNTEDLNINCEKNEDTVENTAQDELNLDDKDEKIFSLSDKVLTNMNQISSPSEHADEDANINKEDKVSSLGSFEQKIVKEYKNILSEYGKDAANSYLNSKSTYLPRGFNPSNF